MYEFEDRVVDDERIDISEDVQSAFGMLESHVREPNFVIPQNQESKAGRAEITANLMNGSLVKDPRKQKSR